MPPTIQNELRDRVDAFVADLTELIREAALESVQEALHGAAAPVRRPGRPRKKAGRRKATQRKATQRKATRKAGRKSGKRVRRSPEDLERTGDQILAWVKANPGQGVEAMSKALRKPSKDLKRPIQILIADKKLRTEGQKRGTTYFAGAGRGGRKTAKRKTAKRKTAKRKTA